MATRDTREDGRLRELRDRCAAEGGIFRTERGDVAVLDAAAAQLASSANDADLTMPDRLVDLLRGRKGAPVSWRQVRAGWAAKLARLVEPPHIERLAARMSGLLADHLERAVDLAWVAQDVATGSLLPVVIAGLSPADDARIRRDQAKLQRLAAADSQPPTWRVLTTQVSAGLVARRELAGRARGRRPRQLDLLDPLVDMLPELGGGRAAYAVTTALTAVTGPPGAVAACLLYELTGRPEWAARLRDELAAIPLADLCRAPTRAAPVTRRFVKEVLRMWSAPTMLTREARAPIDLGQARVEVGQTFTVSPHIINRDPRHWRDPDTFDPDRWLDDVAHGSYYVPFGWAPTSCPGARLGTIQLILLCHLVSTRYRIERLAPDAASLRVAEFVLPVDFRGTITRRPSRPDVRDV
jgi:cytochrome P450